MDKTAFRPTTNTIMRCSRYDITYPSPSGQSTDYEAATLPFVLGQVVSSTPRNDQLWNPRCWFVRLTTRWDMKKGHEKRRRNILRTKTYRIHIQLHVLCLMIHDRFYNLASMFLDLVLSPPPSLNFLALINTQVPFLSCELFKDLLNSNGLSTAVCLAFDDSVFMINLFQRIPKTK